MAVPSILPQCLIFDLEVVPPQNGQAARIIKLGALRPDTGEELELDIKNNLAEALSRLDGLLEGASFVLGHNIISHDLPLLRQIAPQLRILNLPVIDTLLLSPLAFPQNPYHRLVKNYKLMRDSLNSPLADCRATLTLFQDQYQVFSTLRDTNLPELLCYQSLIAPNVGAGLGSLFFSLSDRPPISITEVKKTISLLLIEQDARQDRDMKVCRTHLNDALEDDLSNDKLHWSIAYALAWLRVSGGNSVLAPWVRHQYPETTRLISDLRDTPCTELECQYCRSVHDPRKELKRYFGFENFRYESPGKSLQHDVVLAGMQGKNVLAVLATGGGKSLCYQLPALNRYHRNGSLTIIISPLQSLMKDQVDGLLARNVQCAAALNGLLTMPERSDVLEKISLGDIGILLVSPEQFRNRAFRSAIANRQIGAWIFDEAHCLSKWGNDFRPDYLYAARFIREFSGENELAQIGCFTATAKLDVLQDIKNHFDEVLGISFTEFLGTPERTNLSFEVLPTTRGEKWPRTHKLLHDELNNTAGGAVVFVASRKNAEELSDFLIGQDWACKYFHAGLQPHEKKDIQDDFKDGRLKVIVATNAFGMGVDKSDIRLVIHANIPGSLENYLQEAGRAGRDQAEARCVLLYDPQDIETQFGLSERSKLTMQDIQQILKKLRSESNRRKGGQLIITAGEILQDQTVQTSFDTDDLSAETKVITAIAWLEKGQFLSREENRTTIFPARLGLTEEEAIARLKKANLPARRFEEFRRILATLYSARADQRIDTDQLMLLTDQNQEEITSSLKQLEQMGLLVNDSQLTLYVRHGIPGSSRERLNNSIALERALFSELRERAPDADHGGWQDLHLPPLTSQIKSALGNDDLLPLHVRRLLRSLAQDRDGESQQRSSLELRQFDQDHLQLRIKGGRSWSSVEALGEKRRTIADKVLNFLLNKISDGSRGKDLLIETTFGELVGIIQDDLELQHEVRPEQRQKAIEHVLLYMHQQEVLTLNHGMTVMRRAMTIDVNPEKQGRYLKEDFQSLDEHYRERRIQVHVMREYAELGLREMGEALALVLHYFSDTESSFIQRYFSDKTDILKLSTSESSWKSIVQDLNEVQRLIAVDNEDKNRLVLAGPGSGKTRVIVHRIAYLLRVRRIPASSIIALTFNRHAANEIRQRLFSLVGPDSFGMTVMTYHAMAMRLTGVSFNRRDSVIEQDLERVLENAVDLLEGNRTTEGEDDLRNQLLRGYRFILVDEYQDINNLQYRLVKALAGRQAEDEQLCILAVGDDDQNIYAWRNTSNLYIQRYREEFQAETSYLVENYRSTKNIIAASNELIAQNSERLKAAHPIRIDIERSANPDGGSWEALDATRAGKVLCITIPASDEEAGNLQAQAALQELQRLAALDETPWNDCAILARTYRYLWPVQAWCEKHGVEYNLSVDKQNALPITRQRDFVLLIDAIRNDVSESISTKLVTPWLDTVSLSDEWKIFFTTAFHQLRIEFGDCQLSGSTLIDWIYDYAREMRHQPKSGIHLGTVHSAKGLEFRHVVVLDGSWAVDSEAAEEERRLYYVGMTRARETLMLCEFKNCNIFTSSLLGFVAKKEFSGIVDTELNKRYQTLSLRDIDIGYAGRQEDSAEIHTAISKLKTGDSLSLKRDGDRYLIVSNAGKVVGRTSKNLVISCLPETCQVDSVVVRFASDSEDAYRDKIKCEHWEVIVPRLIF